MSTHIEAIHPVLMAGDVSSSIRFFRELGFSLAFQDSASDPRYAALRRDGVELHVQWADEEQWAHPGDRPAYRFLVGDVDALHREFLTRGVIPAAPEGPFATPADSPWGTREFHLRDPGGNSLQFYRPL